MNESHTGAEVGAAPSRQRLELLTIPWRCSKCSMRFEMPVESYTAHHTYRCRQCGEWAVLDGHEAVSRLLEALAAATAREADFHELIADFDSVTDPEAHGDLHDRASKALGAESGDCGNEICHRLSQFAQREQALHQLVAQWRKYGSETPFAGRAQVYDYCAEQLAALLPVPEPAQEPQP